MNTKKSIRPVTTSTFSGPMMASFMDDFEATLAQMLDCLKGTSRSLNTKFSEDGCPDFLAAANNIRLEFAHPSSAEATSDELIKRMRELNRHIRRFLNSRLAAIQKQISSYGEGPALETLASAQKRLELVRDALKELSEAISHQMKALSLLKAASRLPMDGRYF